MNKALLALTHHNLNKWLDQAREQTVSTDKKLELIMFSLADLCSAPPSTRRISANKR